MKKFIYTFREAKIFKSNLYYCNKKQKYFYLGHLIPSECCDLIIKFILNPVQDILLGHVLDLNERIDKQKQVNEKLEKLLNERTI